MSDRYAVRCQIATLSEVRRLTLTTNAFDRTEKGNSDLIFYFMVRGHLRLSEAIRCQRQESDG